MTSFAFTPPNPGGTDPYPIENKLAEGALDPNLSRMAFPLLLSYMAERRMGAGDYNNQLAHTNQMQYAANQASQANDRQQRILDAIKLTAERPGVDAALTSNPDTVGLLRGTNLAPAAQAAKALAQGELIGKFGAGAQGIRNAGYTIAPDAVTSITGLPVASSPVPIVEAAGINAGGRIAAENIRASNHGETKVVVDNVTGNSTLERRVPPGGDVAGTLAGLNQAANSAKEQAPNLRVSGGNNTTNLPQSTLLSRLQSLKLANPQGYADVMDRTVKNGNKVEIRNGKLVGSTGVEY